MENLRGFYVFGQPVQTEIGLIDFIKVGDYPVLFGDLQMVSMSKLEIIYRYNESNDKGQFDDLLKELKDLSLYDIVTTIPNFKFSYQNILSYVCKDESSADKIDEGNFEEIRRTILDMNNIKEESINPNPEIQRVRERSKRVKAQDSEKLTLEDIFTSLVVQLGKDFKDIQDWTVYQFYAAYHRLGQFKQFETTSLFATVSEKVKVERWNKHIDMFEEEDHFISESQFGKQVGSVFSD